MNKARLFLFCLLAGVLSGALVLPASGSGMTPEQEAAVWWLQGRDRPAVRLCRMVELQDRLPVSWKNREIARYVAPMRDRRPFVQVLMQLLPVEDVRRLTGTWSPETVRINGAEPFYLPVTHTGELQFAALGSRLKAPVTVSFRVHSSGRNRVRILAFAGTPHHWCINGRSAVRPEVDLSGWVELDLGPGEQTISATWDFVPRSPALHMVGSPKVTGLSGNFSVLPCRVPEAEPETEPQARRKAANWGRFPENTPEADVQCSLSAGRTGGIGELNLIAALDPHFRARLALMRRENPEPWLPAVTGQNGSWMADENRWIMARHWKDAAVVERPRRLLEESLRARPSGIAARLELLLLDSAAGMRFSAYTQGRAFWEKNREVPAVLRTLIRLGGALQLDTLALRAELAKLLPQDVGEQLILAEMLDARGRREDAQKELEGGWLRLRDIAFLHAWARLVSAKADWFDDRLDERLGKWIRADAVAEENVREKVGAFPAWVRDNLGAPVEFPEVSARTDSDAADVELLDLDQVLVLQADGTSRYARRMVQLVRNPERNRTLTPFTVRYSPHSQVVRILRTRVYQTDGTVLDPAADVTDHDYFESFARMYFDVRQLRVTFPPAAPGDIRELLYTLEDLPSSSSDLGPAALGHVLALQEPWPVARSRILVESPSVRFSHVFSRGFPLDVRTKAMAGGGRSVVVTGEGLPAWNPEPGSPGWGETLLTMSVGTMGSWEDLGAAYHRFVERHYAPRRDLKLLAASITRGARSDTERIQLIHAWVLNQFRYVSLMFGNHGYMPYSVDEILERKFGDCKDMTLILVHLLRSVGIEAHPAIVRTRPHGDYPMTVPSLALFDHAIVYLPASDTWIDGTVKGILHPVVPHWLQGQPALLIRPRHRPSSPERVKGPGDPGAPKGVPAGELVRIPVAASGENVESHRVDIRVDAKGKAEMGMVVTVKGQTEARWRFHLLESHPKEGLQSRLRRLWPQARLKTWAVEELESFRSPLKVEGTVEVPDFLGSRDRTVDFGGLDDELLRRFPTRVNRETDYVLDHPLEIERVVTLTRAGNWCVEKKPADTEIRGEFFMFSQKLEAAFGTLKMERRIRLPRVRIPRERYADFVQQVSSALLVIHSPIAWQPCRPPEVK